MDVKITGNILLSNYLEWSKEFISIIPFILAVLLAYIINHKKSKIQKEIYSAKIQTQSDEIFLNVIDKVINELKNELKNEISCLRKENEELKIIIKNNAVEIEMLKTNLKESENKRKELENEIAFLKKRIEWYENLNKK